MITDLRALLNDVAAGRIDPGQAAQMLDGPPDDGGPDAAFVGPGPDAAAAGTRSGAAAGTGLAGNGPGDGAASTLAVERIRVTASARPVRIIGDPTVATATVEGPHRVTVEGPVLRVEAGSNAPGTGWGSGSYSYERKTGLSRWLAQATSVGVPMTVRMNPALVADVEVLAGSLEIAALTGPVEFSVTAGSLRLHDCTGAVNGVVRAGTAVLQVQPTAGASSVRLESGSVDLRLMEGSDVRVSGHADLGEFKVRNGDGSMWLHKIDHLPEQVLGAGAATFELAISMGSAKVRLP